MSRFVFISLCLQIPTGMFDSLYLIPIPIMNISNYIRFFTITHTTHPYAVVYSLDLSSLTLGSFPSQNCFLYQVFLSLTRPCRCTSVLERCIDTLFLDFNFPILILSANQCNTTIREHFEYSLVQVTTFQSSFLSICKYPPL